MLTLMAILNILSRIIYQKDRSSFESQVIIREKGKKSMQSVF